MAYDDINFTGLGHRRQFDDPFLLPSSASMPETLETALDMCLFLYYLNPQYVQCSARVARHFITDFDYPGDGSKQEKEDHDDYLHNQLQLPSFMTEMGDEHAYTFPSIASSWMIAHTRSTHWITSVVRPSITIRR